MQIVRVGIVVYLVALQKLEVLTLKVVPMFLFAHYVDLSVSEERSVHWSFAKVTIVWR